VAKMDQTAGELKCHKLTASAKSCVLRLAILAHNYESEIWILGRRVLSCPDSVMGQKRHEPSMSSALRE